MALLSFECDLKETTLLPSPFDMQRVVHGAPEIIAAHTSAVGVGWDIAIKVANSHWDLLSALVATSAESTDAGSIGVATITAHGLNLYVEVLSAAARGMFDTGAHMLRGLADCAGLAFALGTDAGAMDRFLAGEQGIAAAGLKLPSMCSDRSIRTSLRRRTRSGVSGRSSSTRWRTSLFSTRIGWSTRRRLGGAHLWVAMFPRKWHGRSYMPR